jgi:hypothetical protein
MHPAAVLYMRNLKCVGFFLSSEEIKITKLNGYTGYGT